jgi:HEPN domain-containing protein
MIKANEHLKKWLEAAETDLRAAETLYSSEEFLRSVFFLHQTCEKLLKTLFIAEDKEYPYLHDLELLLKRAEGLLDLDKEGEFIKELFGNLNPFYIRARYPSLKEDLAKVATKPFTHNLINQTRKFTQWLRQIKNWN